VLSRFACSRRPRDSLENDPDRGTAGCQKLNDTNETGCKIKERVTTKGRVSSVSARSWLAYESIRLPRYPREIEFSRENWTKTEGCSGPELLASKLVMTGNVGGERSGESRIAKRGAGSVRGSAGASPGATAGLSSSAAERASVIPAFNGPE
jgi:hypothetical protein